MSEHHKPRAKVIPFPRGEEEGWPPEILNEFADRAEYLSGVLEAVSLPIDTLIGIQHESFEMIMLYLAGLPPARAKGQLDALTQRWQQLLEVGLAALVEANAERARAHLAQGSAR